MVRSSRSDPDGRRRGAAASTGGTATARSTALAVLIAAAVVAVLAGCGPGGSAASAVGPPPTGNSTRTISVSGVARTFHVHRPAGLSGAVPLVVVLHGGYGNGAQAEKDYGWDEQADTGRFVAVYPDGLQRSWNAGGTCCGPAAKNDVDDVGFVTQLVTVLEREAPIDAHRVYATGISNGGVLAYRLACETDVFAAIGPDSATSLAACRNPAPTSVIHLHGTADRTIPYQGGPGKNYSANGNIDGPAVPAVNAAWRATDHCAAPVSTTAGAVTTSVATCPQGRTVELITIAGAGHQWPGAVARPVRQRLLHTDPPSTALDATAVIWRFFAAHRS